MEDQKKDEAFDSAVPESYSLEWYENIVKKDPKLLKWFNENVLAPEFYDIWSE